MDSRGPPAPPPHHPHHHQFHHQPPPGMLMHHHHNPNHHPNSGYPSTMGMVNLPNSSPNHPPQMITQNPIFLQQHHQQQQQQHQQQHQQHHQQLQQQEQQNPNNNRFPFNTSVGTATQSQTPTKPELETLNTGYGGEDSSSGLRPSPSGLGIIDSQQKKKRGRPRKYSPDAAGSNIALGLSPTPISSPVGVTSAGAATSGGGGADSGGAATSADKKNRGRPPSSSKLQLDALGNCGVGFTPHVILVNAGEDIASKIVAFSKDGPRTVCVLSANGAICNVSLRQPALSGGVVNYEGRFEIISLSGSFLFSESNGQVRSGGLSVSLAGSDGRVLGGGVAGMLMAATPVQIIVGSFIADGKKPKYMPSVPQSHLLSFSAPPLQITGGTPSEEESSEGSEENGNNNNNNHIDRSMGGGTSYGNSNHPIHNMQMYNHPMGWGPNSNPKMMQN